MEVIRTVADLRARLEPERRAGRTVGMVGTSGGMHAGHQSLIRRAAEENDIAALFWGGAPADLSWHSGSTTAQARDAGHDFPLAEEAGCAFLFAPPGEVMFPRPPATIVTLPSFSNGSAQLEDPAHLDLIALAMCKLWNMFGPCANYFGEKDWQQLVMFQRLAADLEFPVTVLGSATIRDNTGLALSSRNARLSDEQLAVAPTLYRALCASRDAVLQGAVTAEATHIFTSTVCDTAEVVYFAVVNAPTMTPVDVPAGSVRLLASIELGDTRLVDNVGADLAIA